MRRDGSEADDGREGRAGGRIRPRAFAFATGAALVRGLRRLARTPVSVLVGALLWLAPLVGLEVLGRLSPSEVVDGIGVACLVALAGAAWLRFGESVRAAWKEGAASGLRERLLGLRVKSGVDFRHEPPLPRGVPRLYLAVIVGFVAAAVVLWLTRSAWPTGAHSVVRGVSGLLHLVTLAILWSLSVGGALLAFGLPLLLLDAELWGSARWRAIRTNVMPPFAIGMLLVLATCALVVDRGWALVAIVSTAALAVAVVAFPSRNPLVVAWKYAGGESGSAVVNWGPWTGAGIVALTSAVCVVVLASGGERLGGGASGAPITSFLGACFAWSAAYGLGACFLRQSWIVGTCRLSDPSRPRPTCLHVASALGPRERLSVRRSLGAAGIHVRFAPARPRRSDIEVLLEERPGPEHPGGPRRLRLDALGDPELHRSLRRRDEIRRRRELARRLRRVLKLAARREFERGEGFWIGPQHWFVTHLSRDEDEDSSWFIGPPYRRVISRAARSHLYEVLDALEIDLVFLEDGVGFRRFQRVLALVFEYYDLFGGRRLEDERHFSGIPGVRVAIFDCGLDAEKPRRGKFPELDYEDVGRARILHVFKDRGEDPDRVEPPTGSELRPRTRLPRLVPL